MKKLKGMLNDMDYNLLNVNDADLIAVTESNYTTVQNDICQVKAAITDD